MMTKEVTIQVSGLGAQTGEAEEIVIASRGNYLFEEGIHYVEYEEMLDGVDTPLQTKIGIRPGMLVLERVGEVTTRMNFVEGQNSRCEYQSPYGSILLDIFTHEIEIEEQDGMLEVGICYDMQSGPEEIPDCRIRVTVSSTH